jgi:hypothetical protein
MQRNKIEGLIRESSQKVQQSVGYHAFGSTTAYVLQPLPININPGAVFAVVDERIPFYLTEEIDEIIIGRHDVLVQREVDAIYLDGAIYLTNEQDNDKDMLDDIVHEIGHAVEQKFGQYIYSDQRVEREFLAKRIQMAYTLQTYGYKLDKSVYTNTEYDQSLDDFLYRGIGYDVLRQMISGVFENPYSATSIEEYFASGFEDIILSDPDMLEKRCPALYEKLRGILDGDSYDA